MSSRTAVNTTALTGAAATSSRLSGEVEAASGRSAAALARLASSLAGARCEVEVDALRRAGEGVLIDLAHALAVLSRALQAAAVGYAEAESSAEVSVGTAVAPTLSARPDRADPRWAR
jgi:hypothetical protein